MDTSRVPDVIDALVALCGSSLGDDVTVYDGPTLDDRTAKQIVCIGWDGDIDGDAEAASDNQEWAGIGAKSKDEVIVVTCAAIAWTGRGAMKPLRDQVYALVGAVETALRTDPSMGFPSPTVFALRSGNFFQQQTGHGPEARVVFQVGVETRI